jgi:hypothetical protein
MPGLADFFGERLCALAPASRDGALEKTPPFFLEST